MSRDNATRTSAAALGVTGASTGPVSAAAGLIRGSLAARPQAEGGSFGSVVSAFGADSTTVTELSESDSGVEGLGVSATAVSLATSSGTGCFVSTAGSVTGACASAASEFATAETFSFTVSGA